MIANNNNLNLGNSMEMDFEQKRKLIDSFTEISFKYSFNSCVGEIEGMRYIIEVNEDIMASNDEDGEFLIGKATRHIFLLEQAIKEHYDIYEIFDTNGDLCHIMEDIYDYDEFGINRDLEEELFGEEGMWKQNICVLTRLGILPKYRGYGIGKKVIKDSVNTLGIGCDLIVMCPFPLQLEPDKVHDSEFEKNMGYDSLEHNAAKAKAGLRNYYKSIGYRTVKGYDDLMFLTPNIPNSKFDAIDMDENVYGLRK